MLWLPIVYCGNVYLLLAGCVVSCHHRLLPTLLVAVVSEFCRFWLPLLLVVVPQERVFTAARVSTGPCEDVKRRVQCTCRRCWCRHCCRPSFPRGGGRQPDNVGEGGKGGLSRVTFETAKVALPMDESLSKSSSKRLITSWDMLEIKRRK